MLIVETITNGEDTQISALGSIWKINLKNIIWQYKAKQKLQKEFTRWGKLTLKNVYITYCKPLLQQRTESFEEQL